MNQHAVDTHIDAGAEHAAILNLPGQGSVVVGAAAGNTVDQQGGVRAGIGPARIEFGFKELLTADNDNFFDFFVLGEKRFACGKQKRRGRRGKERSVQGHGATPASLKKRGNYRFPATGIRCGILSRR